MRWMKWVGVGASLLLGVSCFMTWVVIASRNLVVTGMAAENIGFGKPGYLHLVFALLFIAFSFIQKVWAKRSNFLVTALNMAWALRNFFMVSACGWGECPEKHTGFYLVPVASFIMLAAALLPDMKVQQKTK